MANIKWSAFTDGGDMQVGDQTVGLRAGDNRRFSFPSVGIKDASGNYLIGWTSVGASAVNYLTFSNSATGNAPFIIPAGTDADAGLLLKSKGNANITLTPSGTGTIVTSSALILNTSTPTTALQAASKGYVDSLMPTYPITLALGGTSANLTASNGGIFYSTATAGAILSGTATANQVLLSGTSSAPAWSTAVYPATTTINQLLYSSSTNTITGLTTGNNGLLVTSNTGVPSILPTSGVTGNMLRSNSAAAPSWSTAVFADTYAVSTILYAGSANSVSGLATANNGVLVTGGTGIPSISSTLPTAVQGNITSVGTISSGIWNGTLISPVYGGTGVNNGTSTLTLGGNLTTVGAFASTFTMTGVTGVTFPTSGTLATTGGSVPSIQGTANQVLVNGTSGSPVTGSAITLTLPQNIATTSTPIFAGINDTNNLPVITIGTTASAVNYFSFANSATGNTPILSIAGTDPNTTMRLQAQGTGAIRLASLSTTVPFTISSGTTYQHVTNFSIANTAQTRTITVPDADFTIAGVALSLGGTNANLTASNGGIVYSTASAMAILAGTATANQVLLSGATAAPAWSAYTLAAASGNTSKLLRSDGTNWAASGATWPNTFTANNLLYASSTTAVAGLATANNGILVTSGSGVPSISNTVGAGLTMPSITFNTTSGIIGTTDNSSAAAGSVGEVISALVAQTSPVALTTSTQTNVTSIVLTSGDWDVMGCLGFSGTAITSFTVATGGLNTNSATLPNLITRSYLIGSTTVLAGTSGLIAQAVPTTRIQVAASTTTTVYLVAYATFTVDVCNAYGSLYARRRR